MKSDSLSEYASYPRTDDRSSDALCNGKTDPVDLLFIGHHTAELLRAVIGKCVDRNEPSAPAFAAPVALFKKMIFFDCNYHNTIKRPQLPPKKADGKKRRLVKPHSLRINKGVGI